MLTQVDLDVRGALTRCIAELGHSPSIAVLAARVGVSTDTVEASLRALHDAHALLLHPHKLEPMLTFSRDSAASVNRSS